MREYPRTFDLIPGPSTKVLYWQRSRYSFFYIFRHSDLDEARDAEQEYDCGEEAKYHGKAEEIANGRHGNGRLRLGVGERVLLVEVGLLLRILENECW